MNRWCRWYWPWHSWTDWRNVWITADGKPNDGTIVATALNLHPDKELIEKACLLFTTTKPQGVMALRRKCIWCDAKEDQELEALRAELWGESDDRDGDRSGGSARGVVRDG